MKSINHQFFLTLKLLKQRYEEKPQYNLFRVLRSESDEVRLHSRFVCDLLNPLGSHQHGSLLLKSFCEQFDLDIDVDNASVFSEYKNIDILIKTDTHAIVIENKIYAGDQDRQIKNYYEYMCAEGYKHKNITLIYLTLDGREASEESAEELVGQVVSLSYHTDMCYWLERLIEISARDNPLREALVQYLDLIHKLTHQTDNMDYLKQLKQLLLTDDLINIVPDIQQAYTEINVDAQLAMWKLLAKKLEVEFGQLSSEESFNLSDEPEHRIRSYVQKERNSRYIGLWVKLEGYIDTYIGVEQDYHLYLGIYSKHAEDKKKLALKFSGQYPTDENLPAWKYASPNIPFRDIDAGTLKQLSSHQYLEEFTSGVINDMKAMHSLLS
ncbi:PDDEXK-like family protein [Vibrio atlanticus]|uniref:PD-(D/E)XK nuclease superfamily protein n=1 Tax=Vibrio atlanticus TaxID=693153 RepID=A0A1C3IS79_9VIBR|nr:PD-(D/E)XK nuclease family protein [Vibrio atlanticus]SBS64285.1 hypothetical protein VAT7223_02103 [Vibrio atlanticus]